MICIMNRGTAVALVLSAGLSCFNPTLAIAADADTNNDLDWGNLDLSFRYRFEYVDQDGFDNNAKASTLKSRIRYETPSWGGLSLLAEVDDVSEIGSDDYNSTRNGRSQFPVVADPDGTAINQLRLNYHGDSVRAAVGRQAVNIHNQRFIGSVAWRQNEQSLDAFDISLSATSTLQLRYGFFDQVNRIFGPDSGTPTEKLESNSHYFTADWNARQSLSLNAYVFAFDFDNAVALSTLTVGASAKGKVAMGDEYRLTYEAAIAHQSDYGDNPVDFSANYFNLVGVVSRGAISLKAQYEYLGGDASESGQAFRTPLATLHKFQGWADQFLVTPAAGIEDLAVGVNAKVRGFDWGVMGHRFSAADGGTHYGNEIDLSVKRSFGRYGSYLLKYAYYDAADRGVDVAKIWAQASFDLTL